MTRLFLVAVTTDDHSASAGWDISAKLGTSVPGATVLDFKPDDLVPATREALARRFGGDL